MSSHAVFHDPGVILEASKIFTYSSRSLADIIFSHNKASSFKKFMEKNGTSLVIFGALCHVAHRLIWAFLGRDTIATLILQICYVIVDLLFILCFYVGILKHIMKNFQSIYVLGNIFVWVIVQSMCLYRDEYSPSEIAITMIVYTIILPTSLFLDACPEKILTIQMRKWVFCITFLVYVYYGIMGSFFATEHTIHFLQQKWLLTDIRASLWWTITIFTGKIWYSAMMHPAAMVLCKTNIKFKSRLENIKKRSTSIELSRNNSGDILFGGTFLDGGSLEHVEPEKHAVLSNESDHLGMLDPRERVQSQISYSERVSWDTCHVWGSERNSNVIG